MFENTHKIAVQPMYSCGCIEWLLAIESTGIVPGIVWTDQEKNLDYLTDEEWKTFFEISNEILIGVNARNFRNVNFHKWLLKYKPKYIEIYNGLVSDPNFYIGNQKIDQQVMSLIKTIGAKIYIKNINTDTEQYGQQLIDSVSALNVKNNKAAGHTSEQSLKESIEWAKQRYKNKLVIASGGLACKKDLEEAFAFGADAVMIGTLFATAKESNLSAESKNLLISKKSTDIKKFGVNNQSALSKGTVMKNDDGNMEKNLHSLAVKGQDGIIFAGHGIDSIEEIKSVKDIVRQLLHH